MVGHKYIRVKVDYELFTGLTEMIKIELVIVFSEETNSPIVAPLDEVHGYSCKFESCASGHLGLTGDFRMIEA
jgi:hypothetical protein